jgi:hypothetical protein
MKIKGKLLEKLVNAGIEIEEREREVYIDDDTTEVRAIDYAKFPCARNFQYLRFSDQIDLKTYLKSDFEHFKFIQDFEAIWSPKFKIIECELQTLSRMGVPGRYLLRKLARALGEELENDDVTTRFEFEKSENNHSVSIGSASTEYAILTFAKSSFHRYEFAKKRPTLRIENVEVTTHEQAKRILEKVGNSLLFKLDITNNIGYKLAEDREIRRSYLRRKKEEHDLDRSFPTYEYDSEPMSLYWYAKSAIDMPLLQFLALYQILEFYFPIFSQKDAHHQIKNIIKDPRFNPNKDSDITRILGTINQNKSGFGFGSELEQLKSTIQNCITIEELRDVIDGDTEMEEFFKDKKSKSLSAKGLSLANKNADLITECAERIYEIRCRVVHTKTSDKNYELLLPSSPELKHLIFDISILETIAKKVLVSTSRLLKI